MRPSICPTLLQGKDFAQVDHAGHGPHREQLLVAPAAELVGAVVPCIGIHGEKVAKTVGCCRIGCQQVRAVVCDGGMVSQQPGIVLLVVIGEIFHEAASTVG